MSSNILILIISESNMQSAFDRLFQAQNRLHKESKITKIEPQPWQCNVCKERWNSIVSLKKHLFEKCDGRYQDISHFLVPGIFPNTNQPPEL